MYKKMTIFLVVILFFSTSIAFPRSQTISGKYQEDSAVLSQDKESMTFNVIDSSGTLHATLAPNSNGIPPVVVQSKSTGTKYCPTIKDSLSILNSNTNESVTVTGYVFGGNSISLGILTINLSLIKIGQTGLFAQANNWPRCGLQLLYFN